MVLQFIALGLFAIVMLITLIACIFFIDNKKRFFVTLNVSVVMQIIFYILIIVMGVLAL